MPNLQTVLPQYREVEPSCLFPLPVQSTSSAELILDSLDLLSDILSRFSSTLSNNTALQTSILRACTPLLSNGRAAVRKRTVSTLAVLINTSSGSPALLNGLLEDTILPNLKGSNSESLRTSISLVGALARTAPTQLSPKVGELVPLVLAGSANNDDEGKEGVLQVRFFLPPLLPLLSLSLISFISASSCSPFGTYLFAIYSASNLSLSSALPKPALIFPPSSIRRPNS
jgi:hypothetical protein